MPASVSFFRNRMKEHPGKEMREIHAGVKSPGGTGFLLKTV